MRTNHNICNRYITTLNINRSDNIFHIFSQSPFTKLRHATHEILILLTFLHPLISIKDRIFFPSVQSLDTPPEGRPQHRSSSIHADFYCISRSCLVTLQSQGKMKLFVFWLFVILMIGDGIKFSPDLQNILKFGYGINYKYEGMLTHSFDRFYIVVKFMLPSMGDLKFSNLNFDQSCTYMNKKYTPNTDSSKYLTELKTYCNKIKPFVSHYSQFIKSYNATVYNILTNEIRLLLSYISKQKCRVVTTLVSGFIGLAYEEISSFLQRKHKDALQRAMISHE